MKKTMNILSLLGLFMLLVFLLTCDGFSPHTTIQLTFEEEIFASNPVWSPDYEKIIFYGSAEEEWGLWTVDPQGDNLNLLFNGSDIGPPPYRFLPNDFSDDNYLLFADDYENIYYLPLVGGTPTLIFEGSSPTIKGNLDGIYNIAFVSYNYKELIPSYGIFLTDIHGSEPQLLIPQGVDPHWSPDGTRLVFVKEEKLWIMDVNNSETILLYDSSVHYSGAYYPRWSPDGYWIAFCMWSGETHNWEIFTIPSTGGNPVRLTELPHNPDFEPPPQNSLSWSSDGKWIVFERHLNRELWKVSVE